MTSDRAPYTIADHQHRFAAWAAATAAASSPLCRFSVEQGVGILEGAGFTATAPATPEHLPDPAQIDAQHCAWRERLIDAAPALRPNFTHGVAAKLLNCYLKARFTCAGLHTHPRVQALHPPVDAVLLQHLGDADVGGRRSFWRRMHRQRWSRFSSSAYQEVIDAMRLALAGHPLWMIEAYWPGHQ